MCGACDNCVMDRGESINAFQIHLTFIPTGCCDEVDQQLEYLGAAIPWLKFIKITNFGMKGVTTEVITNYTMVGPKYEFSDALTEMEYNATKLRELGINVVRKKIEIPPGHLLASGINYFERHRKLQPEDDREFGGLSMMAVVRDPHLHISKSSNSDKFYVTTRGYSMSYDAFKQYDKFAISRLKIPYSDKKIITEYALYDSNPSLDDKWLGR